MTVWIVIAEVRYEDILGVYINRANAVKCWEKARKTKKWDAVYVESMTIEESK